MNMKFFKISTGEYRGKEETQTQISFKNLKTTKNLFHLNFFFYFFFFFMMFLKVPASFLPHSTRFCKCITQEHN